MPEEIKETNVKIIVKELGPPKAKVKQEVVTWETVSFSELETLTYNKDDIDTEGEGGEDAWHPTELNKALYFYPIDSCDITKPCFIDPKAWEELKNASCGFVTGNKTIMPRLVLPTLLLCNNGLNPPAGNIKQVGERVTETPYGNCFNWSIRSGGTLANVYSDIKNYGKRCQPSDNSQFGYVNMGGAQGDKDTTAITERVYTLEEGFAGDKGKGTGSGGDFGIAVTSEDFNLPLIGRGLGGAACAFMIGFHESSYIKYDKDSNIHPKADIKMGEVEVLLSRDSEMMVVINNNYKTGSLPKTEASQVPGQSKAKDITNSMILMIYPVWNGVVCTSGIQSSKNVVDSGLYVERNSDLNIKDLCDPKFEDYPIDNPKKIEVKFVDTKAEVNWEKYVRLTWQQALGYFSYTPAFFLPKIKFSVFFKDKVSVEEKNPDSNNVSITYEHTAYPIFSHNGASYKIGDSFTAVSVGAEIAGAMYYRFDFEVTNNSEVNVWDRRSIEMWGYIKKTVAKGDKTQLSTANGTFGLTTSEGAAEVENWYDAAVSVSVSRGIEGTTGNITLDKYAIMGQTENPIYTIGGLVLNVTGGNAALLNSGDIFSGYGMEVNNSVSDSNDTLVVSLYGLEKKLEDLKLVNAPFWDGDKVGKVSDFLSDYGGVDIVWTSGNRELSLPRSRDFQNPAINFPMGTSVLEAFRTIAEKTNQRFVILRDGKGYFFKQNEYGVPVVCNGGPAYTYTSRDIVSMDIQPTFVNMYNTFVTIGLLVDKSAKRDPIKNELFPGVKFSKEATDPNLPWSKVIMNGEQGYLTDKELTTQHERNKAFGRTHLKTGSIVLPGNASIDIFTVLSVDNVNYFVHQVDHTVNLVSKEWTTSVSVAQVPSF